MNRLLLNPMQLKYYMADEPGGGGGADVVTLEKVSEAVKGLKTQAETAQEAIKKQVSDLEARLKTKSGETEIADLRAKIEKAQEDLKTVNAYCEKLETAGKEKQLERKVKSLVQRIGDAVTKGWEDIKKFKDSHPGQRLRIELFEEAELKAAADMGLANVVDLAVSNTTLLPGMRTLPNRKIHIRALLNTGTMSGSSLTYMRETGGEGAPAPVSENGTKAQLDLDFIEITVDSQYIAGWLRVSRKMLDDLAAFRSYLQMRLLEMYLLAEDSQLLYGNNTAPQLTGLITNATASTSTATIPVEQLIEDIGQLESTNYTADGIILHPVDYYKLALNKASGSGEYDLPGLVVIQNGQMYVAGVPVYKTNAITEGTYLVGSFSEGAQLFIRENPRVEFFDQDRDNVITNKITVRVEGRVALAIYRTEAFIKGTFAVPE